MAGIIDTNILLYGANSDAEEHGRARSFLQTVGNAPEQWYITEGILYEFLRVSTHPRVFDRPLVWREAVQFIASFWGASNVSVLTAGESHFEILTRELATLTRPSGNLFFDVRTVVLMKEYGVREIYTTDTDFLQFSGIKVIDPLGSTPT